MSDTLWIAIITGMFGLLGKAVDLYFTRSKEETTPRRKRRSDTINPFRTGGILNPSTVGLLIVGVVVGILVIKGPELLGPPEIKTATPPPGVTLTAEAATPTSGALTPTSEPAAELKAGGKAVIHTTGGDKLRIHSEPDLGSPTRASLADGTVVTLLSGPLVVGSERWWRIQYSGNKVGWAIEESDGVKTLLPAP